MLFWEDKKAPALSTNWRLVAVKFGEMEWARMVSENTMKGERAKHNKVKAKYITENKDFIIVWKWWW